MSRKFTLFNNDPHRNGLRIVFLHHSTGRRLIQQGGVRELIATNNSENGTSHEFWDHDYNRIGLVDANGNRLGISFEIPDDNTDPDGLEVLFKQSITEPPSNALSKLLVFDMVVFKSCFPVSAIKSEKQLECYKDHYRAIRETLASQPNTFFVCVTPPPLIPLPFPVFAPAWTNPKDADRARKFSQWLLSNDFLQNLENVATFDLFDNLAGPESSKTSKNMLIPKYRGFLGLDSHPNKLANKKVAPVFVKFLLDMAKRLEGKEHIIQASN